MKTQGRERDELRAELVNLPVGSSVILHPKAIKALADKLSSRSASHVDNRRAKLEATISMLDDMGELAPIVRELIRSITPYRDDDGRLTIKVEASLVPFLQQDGKPLGAAVVVAEECYPLKNLFNAFDILKPSAPRLTP
jgi:hypothetical protein